MERDGYRVSKTPLVITENDALGIKLLCEVARVNGTILSLGELLQLTAIDASEEDFTKAWLSDPLLSSDFELKSGFVVERIAVGNEGASNVLVENERERRKRATRNFRFARDFAVLCIGESAKSISICGSTSYGSVSLNDDIDIFCVTKKDELWLFFAKSLLLARFFQLARKDCPRPCLSYLMDEEYARERFARTRDALFARDALTAVVVHGSAFYQEILGEGRWMAGYFPKLYALRSDHKTRRTNGGNRHRQLGTRRVLNKFLYFTVGSYIRAKAFLLNRRLRKENKRSSIFRLRIGEDHCIYESTRYQSMRKMYRETADRTAGLDHTGAHEG